MFATLNAMLEAHLIKHYAHGNFLSPYLSLSLSFLSLTYDSSPATKLKDVEYCNLTDREFKRAFMKKFDELQEN